MSDAKKQYALSLLTGDGWVVTLVGDKPMTLGDTIVETIIVQPFDDYKVGMKIPLAAKRTLYRLNTKGEVVTEEL